MKNTLQYAYSIAVFIGVLLTAYMMMNTDGSARLSLRAVQNPAYRTEALAVDPGVNQLFEMEDALKVFPQPKRSASTKRTPSDSHPRH